MTTQEMFEKEKFIKEQMAYRIRRKVVTGILDHDNTAHYYCPSCSAYIERDYQSACNVCGQLLDWSLINIGDDIDYIDDEYDGPVFDVRDETLMNILSDLIRHIRQNP